MSDLLRYWDQASKQSHGIKIKSSDRNLLRQQLYRAREKEGEGQYRGLSIIFPASDDKALYIVHSEQPNE